MQVTARGGQLDLDCTLATEQRASVAPQGSDTLVMEGLNGPEHDVPARLRFQARVRVSSEGGSVAADGSTIRVRNARSALILIDAATSRRRSNDVSGDPEALTRRRIGDASSRSYRQLRDAHMADHRRLFRRVAIDLGAGAGADRPTDERVRSFADAPDPALAALHFQFGRYLLIASSRPGSEPANLQGIWNDSNTPPWGSKFTINVNTEMNYWPAEPTNLAECGEPLLAMIRELAESGAHTAREMYGARRLGCAPQHRHVAGFRTGRQRAYRPLAMRWGLAVDALVEAIRL